MWNEERVRSNLVRMAPEYFVTAYEDKNLCTQNGFFIIKVEESEDGVFDELDKVASDELNEYQFEELNECINNKNTNLILAIYSLSSPVDSHACLLVINKIHKSIELYDPNGHISNEKFYGGVDMLYFRDYKKPTGKLVKSGYKFFKQKDTCPPRGFQYLQALEKDEFISGGLCTIWSIYLMHLRITYYDMPIKEFKIVLDNLAQRDGQSFAEFIKFYTIYIYQELLKKDLIYPSVRKLVTEK